MRVGRLANVLLAGASICTPLFLAGCDEASSGDVDTTFLATTASTTFVDGIDSTSTTGEVVTPESTTPGSTSTTSTPRTPPTPRTLAGDAQFLLHASFGPTRASLDALQSKDYESWIREQMALTPSLLRSRYRKRANPATTEEKQPGVPRTPCEPGSRWQQVALSHDDIGKAIVATGSQIYVAGKFRTDLDPSYELNGLSAPQSCSSVAKSNWVNSGKSCSTEANRKHANTSLERSGSSQQMLQVNKWRCRNSVTWVAELLCQQVWEGLVRLLPSFLPPVLLEECFDAGFGYDGDDCSQGWPSLNFEGYAAKHHSAAVQDLETCSVRFAKVCSVEPAATVGSQLIVSTSSQCGSGTTVMPNPGIHVSGLSQTSAAFSSVRPGVIVLNQTPAPCDFGDFIKVNNLAYRYDSRLKLLDVQAASQETCVAVPKTAFNAEQCAVQAGRVCSVVQATSATLVLNSSTLELISERSGSYVYTVSGLRTSTAPCGTLSRWKLLDCTAVDCTESSFGTSDRQLLVDALGQQQGEYRDIFVSCSNVAANSVISLGGIVFQHVYLHEGKVYDFSAWVTQHPGGASAITKWANTGYELVYPASHDMSRFETALADKNLQYVGPLGEEIRYLSLPTSLQSESLALALAPPTSSEDLSLACPSPGEAANQPSLGNNMPFFMFFPSFSEAEVDLDLDHPSKEFGWSRFARTNAWINQAMEAPDQLRQRVAWALSQILVTGTGGFTYFYQFETWVNYYDILVRGAFGNYLDLLREVTLSPLMGEYLSFFKNSAFDHDQNYPDENYAREVMQLFTVGTVQLNPDGSEVLIGGNPVPTYDNEDIMTFASVLTGFDRQLMRSNLEVVKGSGTGRNLIDPMQMKPEWHDAYPKMDLDDNYLGDGYPLCEDLPKGAFLLKGARFEFLSSQYSSNDVLTVHSSSALFQALCSASGSGGCSFQAVVVLSQDLSCHADECDATIPSVLKVGSAYYEFVPPACVHLYFYNGKIATDGGGSRNWQSKMQCTNPAAFAGGSYCCDGCSNNRPPSWVPDNFCENRSSSSFTSRCSNTDNWVNNKYCELRCFEEGLGYGRDCAVGAYREAHACGVYQEKVPYATAVKYCSSLGMQICDRQTDLTTCGYNDDGARVWTQTNCSINVSVDETGKVSSQKDFLAAPSVRLWVGRQTAGSKRAADGGVFSRGFWEGACKYLPAGLGRGSAEMDGTGQAANGAAQAAAAQAAGQAAQQGAPGSPTMIPVDQVDRLVRQRLEQAFNGVFGRLLSTTESAAAAAQATATATRADNMMKGLKVDVFKPQTREEELRGWKDWWFQFSTCVCGHDPAFEDDFKGIDPETEVDHSLLSDLEVERSRKLFSLLCSLVKGRPLLLIKNLEGSKNGLEAVRVLRNAMEPKEKARSLALLRQLAGWTFQPGTGLHEQIVKYEEALRMYEDAAGKEFPAELVLATIVNGMRDPLKSQIQLRMTSRTTYEEVREWILQYENMNAPWTSSLQPGRGARKDEPQPMDVDVVTGKGKDKGKKGKGKDQKGKGKDKGKQKGKIGDGKGWNNWVEHGGWRSNNGGWKGGAGTWNAGGWSGNSWGKNAWAAGGKDGKGKQGKGKGGGCNICGDPRHWKNECPKGKGKGVNQLEQRPPSQASSGSSSAGTSTTASTVPSSASAMRGNGGYGINMVAAYSCTTPPGCRFTEVFDISELDDEGEFSLEGSGVLVLSAVGIRENASSNHAHNDVALEFLFGNQAHNNDALEFPFGVQTSAGQVLLLEYPQGVQVFPMDVTDGDGQYTLASYEAAPVATVCAVSCHGPAEVDVVIDSGADISVAPASLRKFGCPTRKSGVVMQDAQGNEIKELDTRILEVAVATLNGESVTIRERFSIARVKSVIISLGRLLRAGWLLGDCRGAPMIHKDGHQVPIRLRRNTLTVGAMISEIAVPSGEGDHSQRRGINMMTFDDMGPLPPELEDVVQTPGWHIVPSGLPVLICHATEELELERSLWDVSDWSWVAVFVKVEGSKGLPKAGDLWVQVLAMETVKFEEAPKNLKDFDEDLAGRHDVVMVLHVDELPKNLLTQPLDYFKEPAGGEVVMAGQAEGGVGDIPLEFVGEGQVHESEEPDNVEELEGVRLEQETPLKDLRELCAKLGLAKSGGKAKILRRLRDHHEILEKQLSTEVAKKMFQENERVADVPKLPRLPSAAQQALHNATHHPFAAWCEACVLGRAHQSPHPKAKPDQPVEEARKIPKIEIDYAITFTKHRHEIQEGENRGDADDGAEAAVQGEAAGEKAEEGEAEAVDYRDQYGLTLVAAEDTTGWLLAVPVLEKGAGALKRVVEQLVRLSLRVAPGQAVLFQGDPEPAIRQIINACEACRSKLGLATEKRWVPRGSHESNGQVEKAVQTVRTNGRTLRAFVENRVGAAIEGHRHFYPWIMRHAAFLYNRFAVNPRGATSFELMNGRAFLNLFLLASRFSITTRPSTEVISNGVGEFGLVSMKGTVPTSLAQATGCSKPDPFEGCQRSSNGVPRASSACGACRGLT
ncbi:unnamed protein product [Symbiodinium sp. CCMP2592]|nr:unnamed protein product [Symbiodinium sp. CCMP2592]